MKVFETHTEIPEDAKGSVVVIGNFDGVHQGHLALIQKAHEIAAEKNTKVSVLTFEPHPRKLFRPDDPPFRITPPVLKAWRMEEEGVDTLFLLPFNWDVASQKPEHFVQNVLQEGIAPAHVVVGYNFRFGQMRAGSKETIEAAGLPVSVVDEVKEKDGLQISSTQIRQALRHGHVEEANQLLGWEWEMRGVIIKGDQRGRKLGYPTANIPLGEEIVHPAYGVYAALVQIEGEEEWRPSAVNIGIKPMFKIERADVESHILDFDADIYGKVLRVRPVQFLRGEAKFDSLEELISQIEKDCLKVREILKV